MGWFVNDEPIAVDLAACLCPGTPHDHDTVWLAAELGPEGGFAVLRILRAVAENGQLLPEQLGRMYAEQGLRSWTFLDEDGEPVPCTRENIARLSWDVLYPIAEKGDDLYAEALLRPLVAKASPSSRNGHTARSTSATRRRSGTRPKR